MNAMMIEEEALKLSPLARAKLADMLQASLEDEAMHRWEEEAFALAKARCEALDRGETTTIPLEQAIEQIRNSLLKR